jgi:hypothetical protein
MLSETRHVRTTAMILISMTGLALSGPATRAQHPHKDYSNIDLSDFLDLGKYYVKPVEPKKDPKTGFVVGGKNSTELIRGLEEINGRTIAELEMDMRPGAKSEVGSNAGFLGPKEKLLDVLAADNQYVVDSLGLTHQKLAQHLHAMGTIALWKQTQEVQFTYRGRRFKVKAGPTSGTQPSPFRDGTNSGTNITVHNLDNGKKLEYALLVPYMIERYGFYEGKGTPYRVEARHVVSLFDFLKVRPKKK